MGGPWLTTTVAHPTLLPRQQNSNTAQVSGEEPPPRVPLSSNHKDPGLSAGGTLLLHKSRPYSWGDSSVGKVFALQGPRFRTHTQHQHWGMEVG